MDKGADALRYRRVKQTVMGSVDLFDSYWDTSWELIDRIIATIKFDEICHWLDVCDSISRYNLFFLLTLLKYYQTH
jgi:hypothetical protein